MEITGQLVLLVLCKIMEAIIRDKILSHFKVNMLFTDKQFGLLKGRSTTLQLLQILDQWTECLEHGGQVDVIFIWRKLLIKYRIED